MVSLLLSHLQRETPLDLAVMSELFKAILIWLRLKVPFL